MPGLANWQHASQKWHLAFTAVPIFFLFLLPTQNPYTVNNTHTHTHISDCKKIVYEVPLLPNNTASQTFLHKSREVRRVDQIFIIQAPASGDWVKQWQWTEHFTIPAITSWPEYPNENQMSIQFSVQELQCFCNDNWMVRIGPFCSHCVCCFLSAHLTPAYP